MAACIDVYNSPNLEYGGANNVGQQVPKGGNDEDRKLFLGGLSWDTTEDDVFAYFSKYGTVLDVSIKYDSVTGNPRGFGFITLAEHDAVHQVLTEVPHTIKNKIIDPKRAKSRPICKKIFVGGVDAGVSEEEIKEYFSQFGSVEAIELPFDRQRGRRREFCFIIFCSEEGADAACQEPRQTIGGRECDIKKAQRQPTGQQRRMHQNGHPRFPPQYAQVGATYEEEPSWHNGNSDNRKRGTNTRGGLAQPGWGYGGDAIVLPRTYRNSSYQGSYY